MYPLNVLLSHPHTHTLTHAHTTHIRTRTHTHTHKTTPHTPGLSMNATSTSASLSEESTPLMFPCHRLSPLIRHKSVPMIATLLCACQLVLDQDWWLLEQNRGGSLFGMWTEAYLYWSVVSNIQESNVLRFLHCCCLRQIEECNFSFHFLVFET